MALEIRVAARGDLEQLTPLVDGYRQFYQQEADPPGARAFQEQRAANQESVVLLALDADETAAAVGFIQLYASFDTVDLASVWILHDLFVAPAYRRRGVARALMRAAADFCRASGAARIDLSTAVDNVPAQALYQDLGYQRDAAFYHYSLSL
jgi:ribosomal protein S18 acetylase RimI-like enzyme